MTPSDLSRAVDLLTGTASDVSEHLGCGRRNLWRLQQAGQNVPRWIATPLVRLARQRRAELDAWIKEQEQSADPPTGAA